MKVSLQRAWNLTSKVGSNELRFWTFFSFLMVELQTSSCFMKVSLRRACNLTPTLGPNELKFKVLFSIMWLNFKPQAVLWRSRCWELEIWAQGLALMSWNLFFIFLVFLIELQNSSCFMKVSFPRAWNVTPRLGSNELKFKVLFSIMWLNFKPQAILWRSHCRELEIWPQGLA
jgi:hypothetical protein